jgi:hypothetical protein
MLGKKIPAGIWCCISGGSSRVTEQRTIMPNVQAVKATLQPAVRSRRKTFLQRAVGLGGRKLGASLEAPDVLAQAVVVALREVAFMEEVLDELGGGDSDRL